jgi:chromosome segregation ATPase
MADGEPELDVGGEGDGGEISRDSLGEGGGGAFPPPAGGVGSSAGAAAGGGGGAPLGAGAMDAAREDTLLSIPAFANAENRRLNERLIARNRALARVVAETREHQERAGVMQEHLKHIRSEVTAAQRVVEAKAKELKTEEHLAAMAERALGRARQDMGSLDGRLEEARSAVVSVQAQIAKGAAKLEAFKETMDWKQEELERWTAAAKQREADAMALDECVRARPSRRSPPAAFAKAPRWSPPPPARSPPAPPRSSPNPSPPPPPQPQRYTRADEQSIRDLQRDQEALTGAAAAKRRELAQIATDTAAKQVELEKTVEEFRALHAERAELLGRLEDSMASMAHRDAEIARQGGRHAALHAAIAARGERIAEARARAETLERENREMASRSEAVARARAGAAEAVVAWKKRVGEARDAVEAMKGELGGAIGELGARKSQAEQWAVEVANRTRALAAAKEAAEEMKARRVASLASTASVEEAVAKKEAFLKREAGRVEKLEKEVAGLRDAVAASRVTLAKLRAEEEQTRGLTAGAQRTNKNMRDRLAELDAASARQAEHAYTADFQIAQLEKRVRRGGARAVCTPWPPSPTPLPHTPNNRRWRAPRAT